jgi:hypothetical protein
MVAIKKDGNAILEFFMGAPVSENCEKKKSVLYHAGKGGHKILFNGDCIGDKDNNLIGLSLPIILPTYAINHKTPHRTPDQPFTPRINRNSPKTSPPPHHPG